VPPFSSGAALVIHPALSRSQALLRHHVGSRRRLLEMEKAAGGGKGRPRQRLGRLQNLAFGSVVPKSLLGVGGGLIDDKMS
jgi:hypothetical protein